MSNFRPDTRGAVVDTFLGSLVQSYCREGGTLQMNNTGMCSQCLGHSGPAPAHGMCDFRHTAQALGCSTENSLRPALGCMDLPGLSCSGSGTWVVVRGADSVFAPVFCTQVRAAQVMRCLASAVAATYRLPRPCHSVFWVYNQRTFSDAF